MTRQKGAEDYLRAIRNGSTLDVGKRLRLVLKLSIPAILSKMTLILMQYIDVSMVGRIGPKASASVGLSATTTWLFGGVSSAASIGFSVLAAQYIGARKEAEAREVLKKSFLAVLVFSFLLTGIGLLIADSLPVWLGGARDICRDASSYFQIYILFLPVVSLNSLGAAMLRNSGNMKVPSVLSVLMCALDVLFNAFLIFPSHRIILASKVFLIPGAGMGVSGAALGTGLAESVSAALMLYFLLVRSPSLHLRKESVRPNITGCMKKAIQISLPVCFENMIMSGAMVVATHIVAPLGVTAIAANSFAVTAESLCYMPGYGIADAATVLTGQSMGAGNREMTKSFARMSAKLGIIIMALAGVFMFITAPVLIGILTEDRSVRMAAIQVLRIEAFAEPLFGASIVISGALRGVGDTLIPSIMNFISMWMVRLPLSYVLAMKYGLRGVWIAMNIELCFRGILFLVRLYREHWLHKKEFGG